MRANGPSVWETAINCGLNLYCDIPVSTLTAAPYNFVDGHNLRVQVAAVNSIGTGAYSTTASMTWGAAATAPATPGAPTTTVNGDSVTITWPISAGRGAAPSSYSVLFKKSDNTFQAIASCAGSSSFAVQQRTCTVSMITFRQAPFSLGLNSAIIATVQVTNSAGTSSVSAEGSGATAQVVLAPSPVLSERTTSRGRQQLSLQWTASSLYSGVSMEYKYRFKELSAVSWGAETSTGVNSFVDVTGLVEGSTYQFQVKRITMDGGVRNGAWSNTLSLRSEWVPYTPSSVTTTIVGSNVRIAWTAPATG